MLHLLKATRSNSYVTSAGPFGPQFLLLLFLPSVRIRGIAVPLTSFAASVDRRQVSAGRLRACRPAGPRCSDAVMRISPVIPALPHLFLLLVVIDWGGRFAGNLEPTAMITADCLAAHMAFARVHAGVAADFSVIAYTSDIRHAKSLYHVII